MPRPGDPQRQLLPERRQPDPGGASKPKILRSASKRGILIKRHRVPTRAKTQAAATEQSQWRHRSEDGAGQEAPPATRPAGTAPMPGARWPMSHSPGRSPWSTSCTDRLCPQRGPGCPRLSGREREHCLVCRLTYARPPECTSGTRTAGASPTVCKGSGGRPPPGCPGLWGEGRLPPPRTAGWHGLAAGGALRATRPQLSGETHLSQKGSGGGKVMGVPRGCGGAALNQMRKGENPAGPAGTHARPR